VSPRPLIFSIALSVNELTRPILDGRHQPQGARLAPTAVFPSEMFWRQLKFAEFDVCEMSLSSLFIAASKGDRRFVALPIFTSRTFFHTRTWVRDDCGIDAPADLKGKRIGVPEYQQTSAVWARGIFQHEFGVRPRDVNWFMERVPDKSHGGATGFAPPDGVRIDQIPLSSNIGEMLMKGELDGTLHYLTDKNLIDRSRAEISAVCRPLFRDPVAESTRYFRKNGIYPINHTVIVKRELLDAHPWAALNIYHAFVAAKREVEASTRDSLKDYISCGLIEPAAARLEDADPKAYGFRAARSVLETLAQYLQEQGLTDRRVAVEDLFAPSTLDL
jgi:4,5-dihydroxyphthalate decarboxylase